MFMMLVIAGYCARGACTCFGQTYAIRGHLPTVSLQQRKLERNGY